MAPRLALLHGFTHTGASWAPVIAALGETYLPVAPDVRGHGKAAGVQPADLEHVIEDIASLVPGRFTLAGYSMGGRIALHIALKLSDRVDRLALIGASPGIADPGERAARRAADEQLAERIERTEMDVFAREWARTPVLGGQPPAVQAGVHADRLRNTPAGLARSLRGLGTGVLPPLWDRLGELTMPVTLIVGERDQKFRDVAKRMEAQIPTASLEVVPGAGHAVHLEAPAAVAALILSERLG